MSQIHFRSGSSDLPRGTPVSAGDRTRRTMAIRPVLALGCVVTLSLAAAAGDPHTPSTRPAAKPQERAPAKSQPGTYQPGTSQPGTSQPGKSQEKPGARGDKIVPKVVETPLKPDSAPVAPQASPSATDPQAHPSTEVNSPTEPTPTVAATRPEAMESVDPDSAMRRLVEGNARFVHDLDNTTPRSFSRRGELAKGQHPFAIVLSCADSRVPPELVFDQELGDLFVVRVAGNTSDDLTLGSMEYAVEHLGSKLIVVMGHTKCGAVKAAVETSQAGKSGSDLPGHLPAVVTQIMPAVEETKGESGDALKNAVIRNVQRTVFALRNAEPTIKDFIATKGLRVVGAVYDIETGEVDFVPELSPRPATEKPAAAQTADAEPTKPASH